MDGDELMGGTSRSSFSVEPNTVTPPPSSERRGSSAPPPAGAFVHTSASERWTQYERDSQLEREAARAHANAVASAAERASSTDVVAVGTGRRPYHDLPPSDRVRAEALKVLERAGDDVSPYKLRQTRSGGLTTGQDQPYNIRRSSSNASRGNNRAEPYSFRRSSGSELSAASSASSSSRRARPPAALAGLDLKAAVTPNRSDDARKWQIDDDDLFLEDEEDLVEIVDTENRITGSRNSVSGSYRDDPSGGGYRDNPSSGSSSPWSSRYSVDQYMSGGATTKEVLSRMDRDQQRLAKSARNMFMTTPEPSPPTKVNSNIFGSGFTFRKNHSPSRDTNLRTVWSDGDPLTSNGRSLEDVRSGGNAFEKARKRRRICLVSFVALCLVVIISASVGSSKNKQDYPVGFSDGKSTTFYVMADVPYDSGEETKLSRDLEGLPGDAAFVIHLGNIQDSSVTLCPEHAYEDVSAVLQKSPAPVFMLPGEHDWNNCPDPVKAWDYWNTSFLKFERNFEPDWMVLRQSGETENFSFLYDGVLIIGLHLVGGRIQDQNEWNERHAKNVDWLGENFNSIYSRDSFRAVVLMGNARPSSQQRSFFNEIQNELRNLDKPVVYLHANPGNGQEFSEYQPFNEVGNLMAVQLEDGGRSPPLRVTVGFGPTPFVMG